MRECHFVALSGIRWRRRPWSSQARQAVGFRVAPLGIDTLRALFTARKSQRPHWWPFGRSEHRKMAGALDRPQWQAAARNAAPLAREAALLIEAAGRRVVRQVADRGRRDTEKCTLVAASFAALWLLHCIHSIPFLPQATELFGVYCAAKSLRALFSSSNREVSTAEQVLQRMRQLRESLER